MAEGNSLKMTLLYKYPLRTIVVFGALLRIIIWVFYQHVSIFPDSDGYIELGALLSNLNLSGYVGYRTPGYPLLLSLANGNLYIVVFLQFMIGIASMVVLYRNMLLLKFSGKSALLSTLLMNSFLHVAFYETSILTESLTLFFILVIFNVLLNDYFEKRKFSIDLKLGLLLAFLVLIKPFYIFIPVIIYGFYILSKRLFWFLFSQKIIILVLPFMAFFGWSYVNKVNTGYFVPTTLYGFNLAQTCVTFAEKSPKKYKTISDIYAKHRDVLIANNQDVAMSIFSAHPEIEQKTKLSFPDLSSLLQEYSIATIKQNPSDYIKQVFFSWSEFWRTYLIWNYTECKNQKAANIVSAIWHFQHYILKLFKLLFLANIVLLLIHFIKNRKFTFEIIITTIILATSILQAINTFGTNSRYSYPFEFLMIIVVLLQFKNIYKTKGII